MKFTVKYTFQASGSGRVPATMTVDALSERGAKGIWKIRTRNSISDPRFVSAKAAS